MGFAPHDELPPAAGREPPPAGPRTGSAARGGSWPLRGANPSESASNCPGPTQSRVSPSWFPLSDFRAPLSLLVLLKPTPRCGGTLPLWVFPASSDSRPTSSLRVTTTATSSPLTLTSRLETRISPGVSNRDHSRLASPRSDHRLTLASSSIFALSAPTGKDNLFDVLSGKAKKEE